MSKAKKKKPKSQLATPTLASAPQLLIPHPDHISEARYMSPHQLFLRFADGLEGTWTFDQLDIDMSDMKLDSIKASESGKYVSATSRRGEFIQLDSASLRYLVDAKYAATIDKSINDLHISLDEAEEVSRLSKLTRDPRWYELGDEEDLLE